MDQPDGHEAASDDAHTAAIRKTTDAVKDSAKEIKRSAGNIENSADRSTQLAADRTLLAAERTYAAWVRTGLGAMASGVGAQAILAKILPGLIVQFTSTVLILFSAFCFFAAVWRELVPRVDDPIPSVRRIPRAILFGVNGTLSVVSFLALISIWITYFSQNR